MGSIRVLPATGRLFMDFRYGGKRCREYTALPDTPASRLKLARFLKQIEREIRAGCFDYARHFPGSRAAKKAGPESIGNLQAGISSRPISISSSPDFEAFAAIWVTENRIAWRESHRRTIDDVLRLHLIPAFGTRPVGTIQKADVMAFRARLAELPGRSSEKMSAKRINSVMAVLRQILDEAADRYAFAEAFRSIRPLKVRKPDIAPFTLAETQRIITGVQDEFRAYYTVRFFTGMRTGEIDGLLWKFVDFEGRQILIRETLVAGKRSRPKTEGSVREIQMSAVVLQALQRQRGEGAPDPNGYVFTNLSGNPLDHNNVTKRIWYPLLKSLGLAPRRPYQTRHTCATLWLASGENPLWIARQLGHTSTEMLFKVYGRFVPNLTRQDGSAFERLLVTSGTVAPATSPADAANQPVSSSNAKEPSNG